MPITAVQAVELAPNWERVAYHEAGHTVVGLLLGIPIHHVTLAYERKFLRWAVGGHTAVAPIGQTIEIDETRDLLFTVAGMAAEAIWDVTTNRVTSAQAWRTTENSSGNSADRAEIAACLPHTNLTYSAAQEATHDELCTAWDSVTAVAEQLRLTGHITARQLARLV